MPTTTIDDLAVTFYPLLDRSPDAPLQGLSGSNMLKLMSPASAVHPDKMIKAFCDYLAGKGIPSPDFVRSEFEQSPLGGAPEASGTITSGTDILFRIKAWERVYQRTPPRFRSGLGSQVSLYPTTVAMLEYAKEYYAQDQTRY